MADSQQPHAQKLDAPLGTLREQPLDYEAAWDQYGQQWREWYPHQAHAGDEWTGEGAGAARSLAEYEALIEREFIAPYISPTDTVLEIGVGGGRTARILRRYCQHLVCADISSQMLQATRDRIGEDGVTYVKLDGKTLAGIAPGSIDVCFCYDTMVHLEPRDIFNYLTQIPALMRGKRLCLFHHANTLSELGWQKFLSEWQYNLMGRHQGTAFSVMTPAIMERFLSHLGYTVQRQELTLVPRDCVWICQAPLPTDA